MKTKVITAVLLFMALCLSAAAQVEKTPFLEGVQACWKYVQRIGYTQILTIKRDTVITHMYPSDDLNIKKHYIAVNPTDQSTVELICQCDDRDTTYNKLITVVFVWPQKGYKKVMPKNLPKMKETTVWLPHECKLVEDRYKNTYAISFWGNPYRPIRGFSTIEPFTVNVNGQTHSGFIEK